ncbi:MAG: hypothetical protein HKN87_19655 [Saprospiraceae bacterium]|nr:hypothetical protein [Saprospiraceae bacterium]
MYRRRYDIHLALCACLLMSCYQDKSGCLDVDANNFSIDADEDCCGDAPGIDDVCCCTYPDMIININHLHGTENVALNTPYENELGQLYLISNIDFYISSIRVFEQAWHTVNNRLEAVSTGTGENLVDDATMISPNSFQYRIGDFTAAGTFDSLTLDIGPPLGIDEVDLAQLSSGHALDTSSNTLFDADVGAYLSYKVELITDTVEMKSRIFHAIAQDRYSVQLSLASTKLRGSDLSIPISVDYKEWFDQVDLLSVDSIEVGEIIGSQIPRSISIIE